MATPGAHRSAGPLAAVRTGLVAAAALVVGLFAGAMAVGVLAEPAPAVAGNDAGGELPGGVPGGDLPDGGASAAFRVNAPCIGAVNSAQDAYLVMDDLGEAAAALDAARLDEVVRRLQPLQARLQQNLDACEVTPEAGGDPVAPADAVPPDSASPGEPAAEIPAEETPTG